MIKNFNEYFALNESTSNEITDSPNFAIDDKLMDELDKKSPKFVCDDAYYAKISRIVCRAFEKNGIKTSIYPLLIKINGKEGVLINVGKSHSVACFRNGIEKRIAVFKDFKEDEKENKTLTTVTSKKAGFKGAIDVVVDYLLVINDGNKGGNGVNEAISRDTNNTGDALQKFVKLRLPLLNSDDAMKFAKVMEQTDFMELVAKMTPMHAPYEDFGGDSNILCRVHNHFLEGKQRGEQVIKRICTVLRMTYTGLANNAQWGIDVEHLPFYNICDAYGNVTADVDVNTDEYTGMDIHETPSADNAIGMAQPETVRVVDRAAVIEANVQDLEGKMNFLKRLTDGIADIVKSNGRDTRGYYRNFGEARGLLVTGLAGIGKSYNLAKTIEEKGLKEYRDYYMVGNTTTGSAEMYNILYQNYDSFIIFDDTPNLFNSEMKGSLWKAAMETTETKRRIKNPTGMMKPSEKSDIFYSVGNSTRQERYFREVGKKTPKEKTYFLKKAEERIRKEHTQRDPETHEMVCDIDTTTIQNMAKKEWIEKEKETTPLIPEEFTFNGYVMIITNLNFADFNKVSGSHWAAIQSRFITLQIEPNYVTVWAWLKKKILRIAEDSSIPEKNKMIPTKFVNDFVAHMDDIIAGKYNKGGFEVYGAIDFRRLTNMKKMMENAYDDETYEDFKKQFLDITRIGK